MARANPFYLANFNTSGSPLIKSLTLDGVVKAESGSLVVYLQDAPDEPEILGNKPSVNGLTGTISSVTVEQEGPVRAVIKVCISIPRLLWTRSILSAGRREVCWCST